MNQDRKPLTTITESGNYRLTLLRPKVDFMKVWDDNTVSAPLRFVTEDGKVLTQKYGTKYPKPLAMLVGKISGKFANEIRPGATPDDLVKYLEPALNIPTDIAVEVSFAKDKTGAQKFKQNGEPMYSYKLSFAKGAQKPSAVPPSSIDF